MIADRHTHTHTYTDGQTYIQTDTLIIILSFPIGGRSNYPYSCNATVV